MGSKLNLTHQNAPVSPNAEDLNLLLGSMTRGRSFSTTTNPKPAEMNQIISAAAKDKNPDSVTVQRRKKSVPNTQKEKFVQNHVASCLHTYVLFLNNRDSSTVEEFFIEVILQRHARRLLQEKKLEALGYMSAALDFHLVGWLVREKDRAARIEDFVATLKQLHDDLDWPKPNLDLKLPTRGSGKLPTNLFSILLIL